MTSSYPGQSHERTASNDTQASTRALPLRTFKGKGKEEATEDVPVSSQPVRYSADCPLLPVDSPAGCPHLINIQEFNEQVDPTSLHLADGIATLLWNWCADEFKDFFSSHVEQYRLCFETEGIGMDELRIDRIGRSVTVYHYLAGLVGTPQDFSVSYYIEDNGTWTPGRNSLGGDPEHTKSLSQNIVRAIINGRAWREKESDKLRSCKTKTHVHGKRGPPGDLLPHFPVESSDSEPTKETFFEKVIAKRRNALSGPSGRISREEKSKILVDHMRRQMKEWRGE